MKKLDLNASGRATSHGPPDRTMPQARKRKMGRLNVHKAPGRSQLRKIHTFALERNDST